MFKRIETVLRVVLITIEIFEFKLDLFQRDKRSS